jgi:hypothetical protein
MWNENVKLLNEYVNVVRVSLNPVMMLQAMKLIFVRQHYS